MIRINQTKITLSGDKTRGEAFIGPAKSQMNILLQDMSFQNLSQGVRRVQLYKDVFIECTKVFNYQECSIYVIPTATTAHFVIILATQSGSEAVLWDLKSDAALTPDGSTLTSITDSITALDTGVGAEVEAVYPATASNVWNISDVNGEEHNSSLIQPSYLTGFYGWPLGYYWYFTVPYPINLGAYPNTSWDFDYIDESPLPYPLKDQMDEIGVEDNEKSSYINIFYNGEVYEDSAIPGEVNEAARLALVAEFEVLTGKTMAALPDADGVRRILQYWHPFFWYSLKDAQGSLENLSSYGRGVLISDSWRDASWEPEDIDSYGNLLKNTLTWKTGGIATKTTATSVESILFEYVSTCYKFVDTYGTGMCDKDLCDFTTYFRIYEHGKITADESMQAILDGTNAYRVGEGTHELVFNSVLSESAQRHAEDMASIVDTSPGLVSHTGTDGSGISDRITDAGYFHWIDEEDIDLWGYKISENVGCISGDADPVAQALIGWRNSSGHWANMIDDQLSELGIGHAVSPGGYDVFVQNFGKVDHRYPGFSPFDTTALQTYVDDNFIFDPVAEGTRMPRIYLVGNLELTQEQLNKLKVGGI